MPKGDELSDWSNAVSAMIAKTGPPSPIPDPLSDKLMAIFTNALAAARREELLDGTRLDVATDRANAHFRFGDSRLIIEWEGTQEDLAELTAYFAKFVLGTEDEDE